jgi:hypothetical protein
LQLKWVNKYISRGVATSLLLFVSELPEKDNRRLLRRTHRWDQMKMTERITAVVFANEHHVNLSCFFYCQIKRMNVCYSLICHCFITALNSSNHKYSQILLHNILDILRHHSLFYSTTYIGTPHVWGSKEFPNINKKIKKWNHKGRIK